MKLNHLRFGQLSAVKKNRDFSYRVVRLAKRHILETQHIGLR